MAITYTTKEACEQIGRSRETVLRWIRGKEIADVAELSRLNHRIWTTDDIERFKAHLTKKQEAEKKRKTGRTKGENLT